MELAAAFLGLRERSCAPGWTSAAACNAFGKGNSDLAVQAGLVGRTRGLDSCG